MNIKDGPQFVKWSANDYLWTDRIGELSSLTGPRHTRIAIHGTEKSEK
jgi:hypothetical protein